MLLLDIAVRMFYNEINNSEYVFFKSLTHNNFDCVGIHLIVLIENYLTEKDANFIAYILNKINVLLYFNPHFSYTLNKSIKYFKGILKALSRSLLNEKG